MYTQIFTDQADVADWSSIKKVQEALHKLVNSKKFEDNITKINESIKTDSKEMGYQSNELELAGSSKFIQ